MNLSERAIRYLKTRKRDKLFIVSETETREYLNSQGIISDEFIRFQVNYSGYELTIQNDPGKSFYCKLFSTKQIQKNEKLELLKVGDRLLEHCGDYSTAQFTYFLTNKGELCTLDDNDLPNILYNSFDTFVEAYALQNRISNLDQNPYYFEVLKASDLNLFMKQRFKVLEECTDSYNQWWTDEHLFAVKGVWFDRPEFYFHVYGTSQLLCNNMINELKMQEILKG
jgi:hypothetical protein